MAPTLYRDPGYPLTQCWNSRWVAPRITRRLPDVRYLVCTFRVTLRRILNLRVAPQAGRGDHRRGSEEIKPRGE